MSTADRSRSARAARARAEMVVALRAFGDVRDAEVLAALARVRREDFVPRFWSASGPAGAARGPVREWRVEDDEPGVLERIYDPERALAIREPGRDHVGGVATSTISAPRIVALMLEALELAPGMRVLEIGLGSGYNAALLRELVGARGSVTSLDIDAGLVADSGVLLARAGYRDVSLRAADGYLGCPADAPFDRIVATVGCADLAPAWLEQLAPDGVCLLPLEHDGAHPLTRVEVADGEVVGRLVGHAAFIAIRGVQAERAVAGSRRGRDAGPLAEWAPLPAVIARALRAGAGARARGEAFWDLAFFVALEEPRATFLALVEGESSAAIDRDGHRVGWRGVAGPRLVERLVAAASGWVEAGRPRLRDYRCAFVARAASSGGVVASPGPVWRGRWSIERVDFCEIVDLAPPSSFDTDRGRDR